MENVIRVCPEFIATLEKFISDFQDIHGIKISVFQATQMINEKIEKAGGFIVD